MKYQKSFKDLEGDYNFAKEMQSLAEEGEIRGNEKPSWPLIIVTLAFIGLVIGALIYGLYNASQIERAARNQCLVVHDPTC